MKYLHYFETKTEFDQEISNNYIEPWVSYTEETGEVKYNKNYLTFEGASEDTIGIKLYQQSSSGTTLYIQVSTDNGNTWIQIDKNSSTMYLEKGQKMLVRGYNNAYGGDTSTISTRFLTEVPPSGHPEPLYVYGNIMSLIDGDNFESMCDLYDSEYTFAFLFQGCYIQAHPIKKLLLPATRVGYYSYHHMFEDSQITKAPDMQHVTAFRTSACGGMYKNCRHLTVAPKIPNASMDGHHQFYEMFFGCSNLINAPELPILTIREGCYSGMFENCTSLVKVPELPATTLDDTCYSSMFKGCTSLVNGPTVLPATTAETMCYQHMFEGCTKLKNAPKILLTTSVSNGCCYEMFKNCTSLVKAPDLYALSINNGAYQSMFYGCSSLSYIKAMFTTSSWSDVNISTSGMLTGTAANGTFVKNSAATWDNSWVVPEGWTVQTATE